MSTEIRSARSTSEIEACYPAMRELRPHLSGPDKLVERCLRQFGHGYHLLAAWEGDGVVGVAGYRMQENLIRGRFCYVDDLVVRQSRRRDGLGAKLLDTVATHARAEDVHWLVLDTGLDNLFGQRFYFRYGMLPAALRFSKALD